LDFWHNIDKSKYFVLVNVLIRGLPEVLAIRAPQTYCFRGAQIKILELAFFAENRNLQKLYSMCIYFWPFFNKASECAVCWRV